MAASEFPAEYCFDWWNSYREIAEPNYSDYIDRTSYFSINVQAVCNNKSCFQDVVLKCPGSIHDAKIFLNSSINGMLQKRAIPPCEKILVEGTLHRYSCWVTLHIIFFRFDSKNFLEEEEVKGKSFSVTNCKVFVTQLKIHLVDLRPDSDVKLENVKPQVIYWCFAFEKNFMSVQRSLSSLY